MRQRLKSLKLFKNSAHFKKDHYKFRVLPIEYPEGIMSISVGNYWYLRGQSVVANAKRSLQSDVAPSESILPSNPEQVISGKHSMLNRSRGSGLSNVLSSALTLNGGPLQDNVLGGSNFRGSFLSPMNLPLDPSLNPLLDSNTTLRATQTLGFGDRNWGITNTKPIDNPKTFPFSTNDQLELNLITDVTSQPENQALNLRGAIFDIAKNFTLTNQNVSQADLQTEIDSHLGSGTAALFGVNVHDQGAGQTTFSINQVEYDRLGSADKQTFDTAVASVNQFYGTVSSNHALSGSDVTDTLNNISSLLGMNGAALVSDLKSSLSQQTDVTQTLNDFYNNAVDLGLSSNDQSQLKSLVQNLQSADSSNVASFDSNALVDNFQYTYSSNRYGLAYDPKTIATYAALTANTLFDNK
ncbi:MAG: hypothetical protein JWQ35_1418 [Bacteriovoracaceae bacterium]|nr:hypothetical protein [Bacteriovoracaceae bacterium]